jgi:hypothetical protein
MVGFLTGRLELHLRRRFNFVSIRMCLGEKKTTEGFGDCVPGLDLCEPEGQKQKVILHT